jgi:hypothetical protein
MNLEGWNTQLRVVMTVTSPQSAGTGPAGNSDLSLRLRLRLAPSRSRYSGDSGRTPNRPGASLPVSVSLRCPARPPEDSATPAVTVTSEAEPVGLGLGHANDSSDT